MIAKIKNYLHIKQSRNILISNRWTISGCLFWRKGQNRTDVAGKVGAKSKTGQHVAGKVGGRCESGC